MKDQKPPRPESTEQNRPGTSPDDRNGTHDKNGTYSVGQPTPLRPGSLGPTPQRPEPMHMDSMSRKTRGRLNRDVMARLGKTLEAYYDDVRKEGVPDRFKNLLQQFDERKDKESS
jgi:hypothetical protein